MGSPWTDKSAILRDLSVAQGRWVPGGIESAVTGAKPPSHNVKEETEEEYYRRWVMQESAATGDFSAGADLFRIKEMLELIEDEEAPNDEIITGPIQITKLKHFPPKFVPKNTKENIKPIPDKPRRARNVAIASIMALANELSQEPLKLIKPEDFIKPNINKEDNEIKERRKDSVNKVTNWLQSQDITTMFKKKSINSVSTKRSLRSVERLSKSPASEQSVKSPNGYTPTVWAEEYYKKAVDRSHVRDLVRDCVWGRAEKIMKEIDAKNEELRKKKAAEALDAEIARQCEALEDMKAAEASEAAEATEATVATEATEAAEATEAVEAAGETDSPQDDVEPEGIAKILLPAPRHALSPPPPPRGARACVVCAVLAPRMHSTSDKQSA